MQKYKGSRRRLTFIDRIRGWHWRGHQKVYNWCGCVVGGSHA